MNESVILQGTLDEILNLNAWDISVAIIAPIVIFVLANILNATLLVIIIKSRVPKYNFNRKILLLRIICDLALVWTVIPISIHTRIYKNWIFGVVACQLYRYFINFITCLSIYSLVTISVNRCSAVNHRNLIHSDKSISLTPSTRQAHVITFLAIGLSATAAIPAAVLARIDSFLNYSFCVDKDTKVFLLIYEIFLAFFIFIVPMIIICHSNISVTLQLKRSQNFISFERNLSNSFIRKRQRLIRLFFWMAIIFVVSWFPNNVVNILRVQNYEDIRATDLALLLSDTNSVTNSAFLLMTCSTYRKSIFALSNRLSTKKSSHTSKVCRFDDFKKSIK